MSAGRVRKLAVLAIIGGAVAAAFKALRGEPTPVYSNHPSVNGGPTTVPATDAAPLTVVEDLVVEAIVIPDEPAVEPVAEAPAATAEPAAPSGDVAWVEPVDGQCPDGYPIKAKVKSGIFHQPGSATYDRTKPDRCYPSVAAAEVDGLRPPKR